MKLAITACTLLFGTARFAAAFTTPVPQVRSRRQQTRLFDDQFNDDGYRKKGMFEMIFDPYPTKIPIDLKEEINRAEENTPAAKDRKNRMIIYGVVGFTLFSCGFLNAFLTQIRVQNESVMNDDLFFGFVNSNFLFHFIFTTKIGGYLALAVGALCGFLLEAEFDAKRTNTEKIWEEMQRRRNQREAEDKQTKKKQRGPKAVPEARKKQSSTQKKRLSALNEVVMEDEPAVESPVEVVAPPEEPKKEESGVWGKLKGMYEKADQMAASQALLLNKELEDRGVLEKITDESGLKIIGKEAASELKQGQEEESKKETATDK